MSEFISDQGRFETMSLIRFGGLYKMCVQERGLYDGVKSEGATFVQGVGYYMSGLNIR